VPSSGGGGGTPPPAHTIPVRQLTLPAGGSGIWAVYTSWDTDHTEILGAETDKHGIISWAGSGHYATNQTTYMILGHRVISGGPGRMQEGHTTPVDSPWGWTPLEKVGGAQTGVAPFSLDWHYGDGRGFHCIAEPEDAYGQTPNGSGNYHFPILSDAEHLALGSAWVWVWVKVVWGRPDGSTPQTGSIKIWIAGNDTPVVDRANIYTHWYQEHMVSFWQGSYWIGGNTSGTAVTQYAGPRYGRTPREAYEDNPVFFADWTDGGSGGTTASVGTVDANIAVPASLQW
jgi:hypothetical protein